VSRNFPAGLYQCPNCREVFFNTDACPACEGGDHPGPPWVWDGDRWIQWRADGTAWVVDSTNDRAIVPVAEPRQSSAVVECHDGHTYRTTSGAHCPECDPAADQAAPEEETTQPYGVVTPPSVQTNTLSPTVDVEEPQSKRRDWIPVAWIVGILLLGVLGANWDTIASGLGLTAEAADEAVNNAVPPPTTPRGMSTQSTLPTRLDPDAGWERGACVSEFGPSVRLVSCAQAHDGQVTATASSSNRCPSDTTHTVDLEVGVACLRLDAYLIVEGFDASGCTYDGIPLHGSVYFTDRPLFADMVIAVRDSAFLADLIVVGVERSFQANSCGLWYIVDSALHADLVVAVTDSALLADFTIAIGEYPFQAGT
jgi:hypothetical protein